VGGRERFLGEEGSGDRREGGGGDGSDLTSSSSDSSPASASNSASNDIFLEGMRRCRGSENDVV